MRNFWGLPPNALPAQEAGTLAQRPATGARPNGSTYFASDDSLGTTYRMINGVWQKQGAAVGDAGGRELGYVEVLTTGNPTLVANIDTDIAGLSLTVTVGSKPIYVEFRVSWQVALGTGTTGNVCRNQFKIWEVNADTTTTLLATVAQAVKVNTGETYYFDPFDLRRLTPTAGSHTYKVTVNTTTAGAPMAHTYFGRGTVASGTWLRVMEAA